MSDGSKIEWTDATWNPVRGCVKISPGCKHCYAETFAERFRGVAGHPYEAGFEPRLVAAKLGDPFGWSGARRVFVNSMSDLFQEAVPEAFVQRVFEIMAAANWHTYQMLTKRADRMERIMRSLPEHLQNLPHVWLGVQWGGVQKSKTGRTLDGRTHDALPSLLRAVPPPLAERRRIALSLGLAAVRSLSVADTAG